MMLSYSPAYRHPRFARGRARANVFGFDGLGLDGFTNLSVHRQAANMAMEMDALMRRRALRAELIARERAEKRRALILALRSTPAEAVPARLTTKQDCSRNSPEVNHAQAQGMTRTFEQVRDISGVIHARKVTTLRQNGHTKVYTHDLIGPNGRFTQTHTLKGENKPAVLTRYSPNTDPAAFEEAFKSGPFGAAKLPAIDQHQRRQLRDGASVGALLNDIRGMGMDASRTNVQGAKPDVLLSEIKQRHVMNGTGAGAAQLQRPKNAALLNQIEQGQALAGASNKQGAKFDALLSEIKQGHVLKGADEGDFVNVPLPPIQREDMAATASPVRPPTPPVPAAKKASKAAFASPPTCMPDDWMVPVDEE
jgi:hypothetical protein